MEIDQNELQVRVNQFEAELVENREQIIQFEHALVLAENMIEERDCVLQEHLAFIENQKEKESVLLANVESLKAETLELEANLNTLTVEKEQQIVSHSKLEEEVEQFKQMYREAFETRSSLQEDKQTIENDFKVSPILHILH
jgi:chromosome segregation ATPase